MSRGRPERLPKWKELPAFKASGGYEKLLDVRKIAVDARIHARDLPATNCIVCDGERRLHVRNATLMVVGSMDRLHACGPTDSEHLCDLIFIIGLGLPVVLASSWKAADGKPSKLAAQGRGGGGIFLHAPAGKKRPCKIVLGRVLTQANPELRFALQHCAEQPDSKWKIVADKGQSLAANDMRANSISQLAAAILSLKTLEADTCRRYKLPGLP